MRCVDVVAVAETWCGTTESVECGPHPFNIELLKLNFMGIPMREEEEC